MTIDLMVVEDDALLRDLLVLHLEREGYRVRSSASGDDALVQCKKSLPDVVVLDLSLPGMSGLDVCAALREEKPTPGVLIVTARASEADILLGFDRGADDYVVKPCRPREIVVRVAALARRVRPRSESREVIRSGALTIDVSAMRATVNGRELSLTPTELSLLVTLARTPGVAHTRKALLLSVFSSSHEGYARNVDCHVTRLRRKLAAAEVLPPPIETVQGAGYRWRESA